MLSNGHWAAGLGNVAVEHLLGCAGTGEGYHGSASIRSAATPWSCNVNIDQNLWPMFHNLFTAQLFPMSEVVFWCNFKCNFDGSSYILTCIHFDKCRNASLKKIIFYLKKKKKFLKRTQSRCRITKTMTQTTNKVKYNTIHFRRPRVFVVFACLISRWFSIFHFFSISSSIEFCPQFALLLYDS